MRAALFLLAVTALIAIGTAEALVSNAQLAVLPGRARPALSGGGAALTAAGVALSAGVYAAFGIVLARRATPERTAVPTGLAVGVAAGLVGGTIRAYLVSDYLREVLAGYGLADLTLASLAVFVVLSLLVSAAAGTAVTWLSFRAARPRTPRPPR